MPSLSVPLLLACLLMSAAGANDRLTAGDRAPELSIDHFIKGERVDDFPEGKVTLVEFWATWCAPCIELFPHISELQEKYADDLVVINVTYEDLELATTFLEQPGYAEITRFRIAADPDGSMQRDWTIAAQQPTLPMAFLVDREGILRYVGDPRGMDRTLEHVITGKAPPESRAPSFTGAARDAFFGVEGTHSADALARLDELRASLSAPGGVLSFEQELVLPGALKMGKKGKAHDLRKTREGVLLLSADHGARLDATRTLHLPGMGGMSEKESVIFDGDRLLLKFTSGSPFAPPPLPTDGWYQVGRSEAQALVDNSPMPIPLALLMSISPALSNPLDVLDALIRVSALELLSDAEGAVVLAGPAAPAADVPGAPGKPGAAMTAPETTTLRIEFPREPGGAVHVIVGDPEAPSFRMQLERRESEAEPDATLFDIGDTEPTPLLPILFEGQGAMGGG